MCRLSWCAAAAGAVFLAACSDAGTYGGGPERLVLPVFAHVADQAHTHHAHLSGAEEVPAVDTKARGQAIFRILDEETVGYTLIVANILNVTQAHIHLGAAGTNGPVVVWLYPSAPPAQLIPGRSQGILAEGMITAENFVGQLAGAELSELLELMRDGMAYVNVHTSQFPPGEIRGQIR
jgi:hypothetical protein